MKKVAIGMAVLVLCAGMAMAAGTCDVHKITYYSDSCYKCDAEKAARTQQQQTQCEEWKTQASQKPSGTGTKEQKAKQQKEIDKAQKNFDAFCKD